MRTAHTTRCARQRPFLEAALATGLIACSDDAAPADSVLADDVAADAGDLAPEDTGDGDASEGNEPAPLAEQVVYRGGEGGYRVYRIPSLIETPEGGLLAIVEGRQSLQDDGDIDLVLRRSDDEGVTWGDQALVVDFGSDTAGNPAPVVDRDTGRLWLPFCSNPGDDMQARRVWLTFSDDDGRSWATPRELTAEVKPAGWTWYATGPGRSILLASGRLVVPSNHVDAEGVGASHVIYSDDHGQTWQLGGSAGPGTDESQVVELADGRLLLGSRYEGSDYLRAFTLSADGGETWGETVLDADLPDPHCQGSLARIHGDLWMSNPATQVPLPRDTLTIRRSTDEGVTWTHSRVIDAGPAAYSALAELSGGRVGLLWESGEILPYDEVRFASFDVGWVEGGL